MHGLMDRSAVTIGEAHRLARLKPGADLAIEHGGRVVTRRLVDGLREDLQDGCLARLAGGRLGREGGLAEALNMSNEIPEVNALHRRDVEHGAVFELAAGVA